MKLVGLLILAYLLGAIPNGVWIGKFFFKTDIRQAGSGNIGTTNTYRVLGPYAGTTVMVLDIAKGTVATLLPTWFHVTTGLGTATPLLFGLFAILGHTVSVFDHFKGGKAVATSAGMLLAYNPIMFVIAAGLWVSLIYWTSMVSLASMVAFSLVTVISLFFRDPYLTGIAVVLTIFVFYRHRTNITRIRQGTESLVPFGRGYRRHRTSK
ncbi:membrane protein [Levilactobacillus namurensis DSM 19117]|uniref:Glycerol-3-phosphate acyltransferase n=1 Tax=Levilactobacillus namurensis DSM 19117 TaxID=1423773 RepID=A0A0R1KA12_9LACO|nr:glycerol-3-phosphate 1-O-acyltransferase PlsY [Levilactobacillus namurensis]KRK78227.1 membrane protein [Levilactobacillus namurensis DSM 19117]MCW3777337.1 glycerol-3-phosphate 1-O-acyltransferase PlsY [Levilactobacillus namurensis]MDT7018597.1 glycerol-3-phosphate 1-O-acyltransferase PlsY [Levilactobacillus namurensis]WNN64423.1 glycerol-3-phosphate 1-O-acyltransferase PlsY [Levilactobacillus namurensis]GEO73601.1 glycerol-3-phosphate acyltransferase [Levilactobacillus namurensis]